MIPELRTDLDRKMDQKDVNSTKAVLPASFLSPTMHRANDAEPRFLASDRTNGVLPHYHAAQCPSANASSSPSSWMLRTFPNMSTTWRCEGSQGSIASLELISCSGGSWLQDWLRSRRGESFESSTSPPEAETSRSDYRSELGVDSRIRRSNGQSVTSATMRWKPPHGEPTRSI